MTTATATATATATIEVPAELIPAIGFLADHFLEDIRNSQAGPYEYCDQERDNTQAVMDWVAAAAEQLGCSDCELYVYGTATYHQADELAGDHKEPWLND